ncbi:MAG: zinc ABC transporter substrate-binding protein [Spirochaetes bacterium]|nr:zinc ABC transporter substrate-binding protein [Spirochaetota bacterium]
MRKVIIIVISFLLLLSIVGCKKTDTKQDITVFVSILPQKYFVEKIAGDRINVEVLVSPGKSPATYEPKPQQITDLGNAKALFTIGVPFEKAFLPKIQDTLKHLKIVDTSIGINKRMMEAHSHDHDDEHHDDEHHEDEHHEDEHHEDEHHEDEHHEDEHHEDEHHEVPDPHIWLSPSLVKIQAKNIYDALMEIDPSGKSDFKKGYDSFIMELDELKEELEKTLKPYAGSTLFVFHPAFGYFTDEFGLKQVAIETGGKEPAPAKLTEIIEHAQKEGVKIIFVQPEFSQESAKKIAQAIGGTVVLLNPLNPDYINNLKSISTEVAKAFK